MSRRRFFLIAGSNISPGDTGQSAATPTFFSIMLRCPKCSRHGVVSASQTNQNHGPILEIKELPASITLAQLGPSLRETKFLCDCGCHFRA
jgi:hypothetical protein